jgi:hypothetical protein
VHVRGVVVIHVVVVRGRQLRCEERGLGRAQERGDMPTVAQAALAPALAQREAKLAPERVIRWERFHARVQCACRCVQLRAHPHLQAHPQARSQSRQQWRTDHRRKARGRHASAQRAARHRVRCAASSRAALRCAPVSVNVPVRSAMTERTPAYYSRCAHAYRRVLSAACRPARSAASASQCRTAARNAVRRDAPQTLVSGQT